jgi:transposase InsO family protein
VSKQGYYSRIHRQKKKDELSQEVLQMVAEIRKEMPRTGTRKLYAELQTRLKDIGIKMGRDALFNLLRDHGLLIRKTKSYHITTDSKHFFYRSPNLLKPTEIQHAEQAFVCDITYIKTDNAYAYLSIVTDIYSKKIMGWCIDDNMKVGMVKEALKMANKNRQHHTGEIIHHSDRGIQYCCPDYTEFAEKLGYKMSTTEKYDPYENAVAERINGILKYEFGLRKSIVNIEVAKKMTEQAVRIYNSKRRHWSLGLDTPDIAHQNYNQHNYVKYSKNVA